MKELEITITEELNESGKHVFRIEMDAEQQEAISIVQNMLNDNNLEFNREFYQSKYNSYVVYDYKPFCFEGFIYGMEFDIENEKDKHTLSFISYLLSEWVSVVNKLNKLIELTK